MDPLSTVELRVLGALLEKAVTTPDQYPMTVNALVSAANQKSSRDPVMTLSEGEVKGALQTLETKLLVSADPNLRGRAEKYLQRFCKPPFGVYDFDDSQYAVLTVLMLRGPATPGELRTRTDRLHKFSDNQAVVDTLNSLRNWTPDALVVELPREPNRRDNRWSQLFGEVTDQASLPDQPAKHQTPTTQQTDEAQDRMDALEQRVAALEIALETLQKSPGD